MIGTLNSNQSDGAANLTRAVLEGPKKMMDTAMQIAAVELEMKTTMQQQETVMQAVAMMTGVGTKIDTMA